MATATKTKSKSSNKLQPLGDRVVVQREESEGRTSGGILLPDSAKEKPQRGVIISVGDGKLLDNGTRGKLQVQPGNRVIFTAWAGENFKVDGDEYLLMREEDILAVITD
jgi:chaperonin GroES